MSRSPVRDFVVGLFILAGLAAIAYLSINVGGLSYNGPGGLTLYASFDQTGGLKARAPGSRIRARCRRSVPPSRPRSRRARATLNLDAKLALPTDTTASIQTAGLLGDRYVALQLGGEEKTLKSGDEISFTESAVILERLIGKLVHNAPGPNDKTE